MPTFSFLKNLPMGSPHTLRDTPAVRKPSGVLRGKPQRLALAAPLLPLILPWISTHMSPSHTGYAAHLRRGLPLTITLPSQHLSLVVALLLSLSFVVDEISPFTRI